MAEDYWLNWLKKERDKARDATYAAEHAQAKAEEVYDAYFKEQVAECTCCPKHGG